VLAAPVTALLGDPAAAVAYGTSPDLAAGWSLVLPGGGYAIGVVAALLLLAGGLGLAVGRRVTRIAPSPYLSGATLGGPASPAATFHGPRGEPVDARSGGFYWGRAGDTGETPGTGAPAPGAARLGLGKLVIPRPLRAPDVATASGWLAVGLLVVAAVASAWVAAGGPVP
jgi:hypothetical protein